MIVKGVLRIRTTFPIGSSVLNNSSAAFDPMIATLAALWMSSWEKVRPDLRGHSRISK